MGFGLITAGLVFLCNPVVGIFDVFPDLIGFFLIFCGLKQGALAFPTLADVRRSFVPLLWIGAGKIALSVLVELFGEKTSAFQTTSLIITFLFCCLELIFLIPAVRRLLDGIVYVGSRCDSRRVFIHAAGFRRYTTVFLIFRAVLPMIPEFSALSSYQNLGYVTSVPTLDFSQYKSLFIVITVFMMILLGVAWLIWMLCYFIPICREKTFLRAFSERFQNCLSEQPGVFIKRALSLGLLLLTVAMFFNLDFYVALNDQSSYDEDTDQVSAIIYDWGMVNVVPDILCVVIAAAGLFVLRRESRKRLLLSGAIAVYASSAIWSYANELLFNSMYVTDDIFHYPAAEDSYRAVVISNGVKDAAFILFLLVLTLNLISLVGRHTGVVVQHPDHLDNGRLAALHRDLKKRLWLAFAFGTLSALVSIACVAGIPESKPLWMLDFLFTAIHAVLTLSVLGRMRHETDAHYD